ncbi:MAG: nuclear transport factor 2 family protein [Pseudomonadales bacterium]|nr:nuclear transport factor 2 family protein [Pseudomonadales bacterium]
MSIFRYFQTLVPAAVIWALSFLPAQAQQQLSETAQKLAAEVAFLAAEVQALEDENEIENLQRIFGFYIDKNMWTQAADLFAGQGSVEIGGGGVYVGKERILAYFQSMGAEGPQAGILNDHMQLQPVIDVFADGTAKGRWRHFSQEAVYQESQHWGTGIYENDYIREDGVWKIQTLHLYSTMRTSYEAGWGEVALPRSVPSTQLPPDLPPSVAYENYPAVFVVPFHYQNPVTGSQVRAMASAMAIPDSLAALDATLDKLDKRVALLEDADAVEYVHTVYGYYLARNQWDELTGIFAEDGTIEIAMRGIYQGKAGIRRNLDLYGVQGELPGILHNHMQYQPVIHVAADGQSALMRSRAFSMMGGYEGTGRWMGGVYENLFIKRDGIWQIAKDQVFNTYFIEYERGWKDQGPRPPPGINPDNPPDLPPSVNFDMYPLPFLPPYHYRNPVSGR